MATIRDVANHCGVSAATVSHVLNGRNGRVGADTRERVLAAVRELRYRPPAMELGGRDLKTRNLALVAGDLSPNPLQQSTYFSLVLSGVLEGAATHGYSLTISVERMWDADGGSIRRSFDGRCDGVIVMAPERDNPLAPSLLDRGLNVAVVGSGLNLPGVSYVDVENEAGAALLVRHLRELGHTRIAYAGGGGQVYSVTERLEGYRHAMAEAGLESHTLALLAEESSSTAVERTRKGHASSRAHAYGCRTFQGWGQELAALLEAEPNPPTAVVCWNDDLARSLCRGYRALGVDVPGEVSVVSFDDTVHAMSEYPNLTVLRQPLGRIGRCAAELVIERAEDPHRPPQTVRFPTELVVRDSAGPHPHPDFPNRRARTIAGPDSNAGNHHVSQGIYAY